MESQKHAQSSNRNHQPNSEEFDNMMHQRRSANYKPNIWKYDFLQSLHSKYDGEEYERLAQKLKDDIKLIFLGTKDFLAKLELVDRTIKLGLAIYFEEEIKETLETISSSIKDNTLYMEESLYITALSFRLLREFGYEVTQDMFSTFVDGNGMFIGSKCTDTRGMLELYEASHLAFEGECLLNDAQAFLSGILKHISDSAIVDSNLVKRVVHALELPYHWRVQWFDVKWHINICEEEQLLNKALLELAKVNFNVVQSTLQKDLRDVLRWWRDLGLMEKLSFVRDRVVESFLCAVGVAFEPKFSSLRIWLTKAITMVLIVDDVYDLYGSVEELQCFTNAVNRWDLKEIKELPECMRTCFDALYRNTNEVAQEMQCQNGSRQVQLHLKKGWLDFCKALLVESKWYNNAYIPSLKEYMNNAWISSSGIVLSLHILFSIMNQATTETMNYLEQNQQLLHNISLIIRFCNDLGTSEAEQERGDAASSILCYMEEVNVGEEAARNHINGMINSIWKKINKQGLTQLSSDPEQRLFVNLNINMARVVHYLYLNGDKFSVQDPENKKYIVSLLVEPFKLD